MTIRVASERSSKGNSITAGPEQNQLLLDLRVKPFWYFDQNRHKEKDRASIRVTCCFNHIIGLPKKDGIKSRYLIMKGYYTKH